VDYQEAAILDTESEDSDVYVLRVKRLVSLTPLSLDFTARVDFEELNRLLRSDD
jgi:broad specificity polyphosphatase/5'/3'-nucleotidase SurE